MPEPTQNPWPLNAVLPKVNHPLLQAWLEQYGDQYYVDAGDVNLIFQALQYLYENIGGGSSIVPNIEAVLNAGFEITTPTQIEFQQSSIVELVSVLSDIVVIDINGLRNTNFITKKSVALGQGGLTFTNENELEETMSVDFSAEIQTGSEAKFLIPDLKGKIKRAALQSSMLRQRVARALTTSTTLQKIFDGGENEDGSIPMLANSFYSFKLFINITGLSTTNGSFGFGFLGTVGIANVTFHTIAAKGGLASASTPQFTTYNSITGVVTVTNSTQTTGKMIVEGHIETTTEGDLFPSIILSSSTSTGQVEANTVIFTNRIGDNNTTFNT